MDIISYNFLPFLFGSVIGTGAFAFYVEFGKGMGKILFRPNIL